MKFKTFREVVYDAVGQGTRESHEVFAQCFIHARCLDDVAGERTPQDATVLSDGVHGDDDEWIFGQAFRYGGEFAFFDFFSEDGGFPKGAVDQDFRVDLYGCARFVNRRVGLCGFTCFCTVPWVRCETTTEE